MGLCTRGNIGHTCHMNYVASSDRFELIICTMSFNEPSKVSVCKIQSVSIVHHVKIIGHSLAKRFVDTHIEVSRFDLAGDTWAVQYRPTFLVSMAMNLRKKTEPLEKIFTKACGTSIMETSRIEYYAYCLKNDSILIQCSLRVEKPSCTEENKKQNVMVPPPDLNQHLGCLIESEGGADVTFHLNKEMFVAHKAVLAARSPVFRAQLFGSMMESKTDSVKIEEMKPEVFKAMLHFIYTETLPPGEDVSFEIAQHLLVAADRYGLERLKAICAKLLCAGIDAKTAVTTLSFAARHSCPQLKAFCVDFLVRC
ncbi:BTB/POZ and MATH domain-containing protein 2 [Rhynchospora pubera]|uniref:BTB/POZ and MATH domain-containing protein 2 n=1 Tax=Rhynchospora pubera TaxID=906938 RepID=A0AAV8CCW3_9POAL|nr:BTB/POZ and MATH domain-containing protein 2 [Rhynchospora pubera]